MMSKSCCLILIAALVAGFPASGYSASASKCSHVERPPAQYRHAPAHKPMVMASSEAMLRAMVRPLRFGDFVCGFYSPSQNAIYYWDRLRGSARARVIAHEMGHANGWRH